MGPHARRTAVWRAFAVALSCVVVLVGCKSAKEKCAEARAAGKDAWIDYVQALEHARTAAAIPGD